MISSKVYINDISDLHNGDPFYCSTIEKAELTSDNSSLLELLPNLKHLECHTDIQNIPLIPSLQSLNCSSCNNIYSLPRFPELVALNCSYCPNLRYLKNMPKLKSLNCSECFNLRYILKMPELLILNCYNCTNLGVLPVITDYISYMRNDNTVFTSKIAVLDCRKCGGIKHIITIPSFTHIQYEVNTKVF